MAARRFRRLLLACLACNFGIPGLLKADDQKPSFQVTVNHIDRVVADGQPDGEYIGVENTGRVEIKEISYQGDLKDPKSGAMVRIALQNAELGSCKLLPSNQCFVKLNIPNPVWAGSYSGALTLTSPGADWRSIGVELRSRGPLGLGQGLGVCYWLPMMLFSIVVGAGFALSWLLDKWLGTDLPRDQALVSLRNSETGLTAMANRLGNWQTKHPGMSGFPLTGNRLAILVPEIVRLIANARQAAPADLTAGVQSFGLASAKLFLLSSVLDLVESENTNSPAALANLNAAINKIDAIDFSDATPLVTYRTNILNALGTVSVVQPAAPGAPGAVAAPGAANVPDADSIAAAQRKAENHIKLITGTQQLVIWIVVGLTGFATIFLPNLAYGTAADYIASFLWSLGLTQTGKQLISRAH
jgi:hypothetical protein